MLFHMAILKIIGYYYYFPDEKVKAKTGYVSWPLKKASKWYSCYFNTNLSVFKNTFFHHV